jgi:hypothetical protein
VSFALWPRNFILHGQIMFALFLGATRIRWFNPGIAGFLTKTRD